MLIDTHAHLNFNAYKDDLSEVIARARKENVWVIIVGSNFNNSKKAVEIAETRGQGFFAAVGLHPIHLAGEFFKIKKDTNEQEGDETSADNFNMEKYKELVANGNGKVVAIGEIGLDYYYRPKTKLKLGLFKQRQKEFFIKQLDLAKELNLPVIFHCRMAHEDMIDILKSKTQNPNSKITGVVHCFTGTWQEAQQYLNMGLCLGINGIMYKLDLTEVIKNTPLEKLLVETDCPYLTPPLTAEALAKDGLNPGVERNEPAFVKYIAEKIAELKGVSFEEVCQKTTENARRLFKI